MGTMTMAMNNGSQGHKDFVRYAFDKPMFIPSYAQAEQFSLSHEKLSASLMEKLVQDKEVFYQFMDKLCESEQDFHHFAELWRMCLVDESEHLDRLLELRQFGKQCLTKFIEDEAHKQLIGG